MLNSKQIDELRASADQYAESIGDISEVGAFHELMEKVNSFMSSSLDNVVELINSEKEEYELIQDDMVVTSASGRNALAELKQFAHEYDYAPVEIFKVTRTKVEL